MMKQYAVKVTDEALEDMRALRDYIENELLSPGNAERQYRRIAEKILTLSAFPEKYALVDFEPERSRGLHRAIVDHYSVFYVIEEDRVVVTNVLYSASGIENRIRN